MSVISLTDIVSNSTISSSVVNAIFGEIEDFFNGTTASADQVITGSSAADYFKTGVDGTTVSASGAFTVGTSDDAAFLYDGTKPVIIAVSALTNNIQNFSLKHTTTGTPAIGIGTGLEFITETSAGNNEIGTILESVSTDTTATSESFDFILKLMAAGSAAAEVFKVTSIGNVTFTGSLSNGSATLDGSGAWTGVTSLTVDNLVLDANDISTSTGNLTLTPEAGSSVVIDGGASFDGSVLTGLTSITSTAIIGTLSTASQTNITGLGAVNAGSITSGFGSIDNGASNITTTGVVTSGIISRGAPTSLTIASGAVTMTKSNHTIETESGASSDDLDTINGGSDGYIITIRSNSGARIPTVKDTAAGGNLLLESDFIMNAQDDTITLMYVGAFSKWVEISRANNGT
tara:strand:+ start:12119 stop:13330 length:1212 start_codon:yes stop_codon:yes gene_type:complete